MKSHHKRRGTDSADWTARICIRVFFFFFFFWSVSPVCNGERSFMKESRGKVRLNAVQLEWSDGWTDAAAECKPEKMASSPPSPPPRGCESTFWGRGADVQPWCRVSLEPISGHFQTSFPSQERGTHYHFWSTLPTPFFIKLCKHEKC